MISHHDEDHLDMDIIPEMMQRNAHTKLLAPKTAYDSAVRRELRKDS